MAVVTAVMSVVSGVVGAIGAIQQANAAAASAEYNAKVQERNRQIALQDRKTTLTQAQLDADDQRRENRRTLSTIRAMYGSSGLSMAGSPLDVLSDTATEIETDAQRIEYEGEMTARNDYLRAVGFGEQAELYRMEASAQRSAGPLAAFGYLARGIGGAGRSLARMN